MGFREVDTPGSDAGTAVSSEGINRTHISFDDPAVDVTRAEIVGFVDIEVYQATTGIE